MNSVNLFTRVTVLNFTMGNSQTPVDQQQRKPLYRAMSFDSERQRCRGFMSATSTLERPAIKNKSMKEDEITQMPSGSLAAHQNRYEKAFKLESP